MELVLVLIVVSVVLALATPSFRGFFASRQTADAAATMLSLTRYARSQAVAEGRSYRLNFDAQSNAYWLTAQQGGAFVALGSDLGRRFRLPEGAAFSLRLDSTDPSRAYVQFLPNGRADAATVEIKGRQGEVYRVTCPSAAEPYRLVSPSEASPS